MRVQYCSGTATWKIYVHTLANDSQARRFFQTTTITKRTMSAGTNSLEQKRSTAFTITSGPNQRTQITQEGTNPSWTVNMYCILDTRP